MFYIGSNEEGCSDEECGKEEPNHQERHHAESSKIASDGKNQPIKHKVAFHSEEANSKLIPAPINECKAALGLFLSHAYTFNLISYT